MHTAWLTPGFIQGLLAGAVVFGAWYLFKKRK